jgi:hypothetical protein
MVKLSNTKVIVLLSWPIVSLQNVIHVIVHVITYFLLHHVLNVRDAMFIVINNIMMIEKNLFNHVEVKLFLKEIKYIVLLCLLVYDTLTVKDLLIMCTSEVEQKQWIHKLSRKITKRPANNQNEQWNSSR